ncbi:MAG: hypothetical protein ACI9F9_000556 [Candidatus Paceibacteria bacterium]|jgi:hypothetical protein
MKTLLILVVCLLVTPVIHAGVRPAARMAQDSSAEALTSSAVGVPGWKRELVLEGSEVEVLPATPAAAMVLRIDDVRPHGSGWRYDIEYYGLEPGRFDLRDYLRRKDGSPLSDLAAIEVIIKSTLPEGVIRPNPLESGLLPSVGGYQFRAWVFGALWIVGLWLIVSRRGSKAGLVSANESRPETLADRLRPLVEKGISGELSNEAGAQLEMTLITFWRRKLELHDMSSAQAMEFLKGHAEAGPLLRQLERWLHSPGGGGAVDVTDLLVPYRNIAAADLELTDAGSPQAMENEYA